MRCVYCGSELKPNCLFCSNCGKEAQMVPDYNALDDDLLNRVLVEGDMASEDEELSAQELIEQKRKQEQLKAKKKQKEIERLKQQKKKRIIIISFIAAFVLLLLIILLVVFKVSSDHSKANSFEYQVEQGQKAEASGNLDDAIDYYENAANLDKSNIDVRLKLADLCLNNKNYNKVIVSCSEVIALDANNLQAYEKEIQAYEKMDDYDSIIALSQTVKDPKVLSIFDDYIVTSPISNYESGTLDDFSEIELSCSGKNKIYYTLNDDDPKGDKAIEYTSPISLDTTGKHVIHAVCKNDKGLYSDVVDFSYLVDLAAPVSPVYSTDGGLDTDNSPIDGAFYLEDENVNSSENTKPPVIKVNVPDFCTAVYEWNNSRPNITSDKYDSDKGIEVQEGNNVLYIMFIDERTDKCSEIKSRSFEYYPN